MKIEKSLVRIKVPKIYKREGKDCYYDTYRKKLIEITPEETVRQKVASLFELKYGVPKEMISLEVPMSSYVVGATGRADIVIHAVDIESNTIYPVAVIECKKEDVLLTDKVAEQAIRYCNVIGGSYIILTNGIEIEIAAYDEDTDSYVFLDKMLSYDEMINREYILPEESSEKFVRFTFDELKNQNLIEDYNENGYWIFGKSSNEQLKTFAVNFFQCLLDTKHLLPKVKRKTFELIEDIGQRYMDYTNAGGGHYDGVYRGFLIKDRFDETQIVSLSILEMTKISEGRNAIAILL